MKLKNLADLYHLDPIPWARVLESLASAGGADFRMFLATTGEDGHSHLAGIGAVWEDEKVYFVSGEHTRKSRDVARNPNCAVSFALADMDVVFEGAARRVTDAQTLQRLAERYARDGWPASVKDDAFTYDYSAPSAGPPPWNLYEIRPRVAFVVLAAAPGGAMRYDFDDGEDS